MSRVLRVVAWGIGLAVGAVGPAMAQDQTSGFVPVASSDIAREALPASPLVYAAYAFVWVALTVYVFLLWRRLDRVERELADVSAKLVGRP